MHSKLRLDACLKHAEMSAETLQTDMACPTSPLLRHGVSSNKLIAPIMDTPMLESLYTASAMCTESPVSVV